MRDDYYELPVPWSTRLMLLNMKEKVPNKTHTREPKVNDKSPNKTRMREKGNLPWPLSSEVLTRKKDDE